MKIIPVHHVPMRADFNSPFSAGYVVEKAATAPCEKTPLG